MGCGESGLDVADLLAPHLLAVAVHVVKESCGIGLEGLLDSSGGGDGFPVDEYFLGGIGGGCGVGGDDGGYAFAHVAHFAGCEGMVRACAIGLAVG